MSLSPTTQAIKAAVFLMTLAALVHVTGATTVVAQKPKSQSAAPVPGAKSPQPQIRQGTEGLPAPVLEMREAILAAVRSGTIEEIRVPIEMNEIKPSFGDGPVPDPVAHLKAASSDGKGKEVLEALGKLLDSAYAIVPLGKDLENNRFYVWPALAATGVSGLSNEQEGELKRLAPEALATEMISKGGPYTYWRVAIAADGTWHVFSKSP